MTAYPDSIHGIDPVADSGTAVGLPTDAETADFTDRLADATLLVVGPPAFGQRLVRAFAGDPLSVRTEDLPPAASGVVDSAAIRAVIAEHDSIDGVLAVVPRETDLACVPGPLVEGVPVGIVRADRPTDLDAWCGAVGAHRRHTPAWAVLSMGKDAFLEPAGRLHRRLVATDDSLGVAVDDWRADRVDRPELCRRLATGPTLAVYLGHGRRRGWSGYQSLRWNDVAGVPQIVPTGTLLALTCDGLATAEDTTDASFLERFVSAGRAGAVVGSVGTVQIDALEGIIDRLGKVVSEQRPKTLGELLHGLFEATTGDALAEHLSAYRIVGLPIQPLR